MRIKAFTVQGYKNLHEEVRLDGLSAVSVFHGENNVGKSNLIEAIGLFYRCCAALAKERELPHEGNPLSFYGDEFLGVHRRDIFTIGEERPIVMTAEVLDLIPKVERVGISLVLIPNDERVDLVMDRCVVRAAKGHQQPLRLDPSVVFGLLRTISKPSTFAHIQVDRTRFGDGTTNRAPHDRGLVPTDVALQLYDARDSLDAGEMALMALFQDVTRRFEDVFGGEVGVVYQRQNNAALLVVESPTGRIPSYLLGTGAQQLLALIGRVLMTKAEIVAIEEPELNLRLAIQQRLAEAFQLIVQDARGPQQILITSHSPVFERGGDFFHVERMDGEVRVTKKSVEAAGDVTGVEAPLIAKEKAPRSYISTEGDLRFGDVALAHLGPGAKGNQVFVLRDKEQEGVLQILSEAAWYRRHPSLGESDGPLDEG